MKKIELRIIALANSDSNMGNFTLILEALPGTYRLPIIIGPFEAQAIAVALEGLELTRPMTHDLFKNTLTEVGISLTEAFIYKIESGVFFARLMGKKADGSEFEVDARSSDAIAMAVRFKSAIYTTPSILEEVGIPFEKSNQPKRKREKKLSDYSMEELQQMLEQVLEEENYERAAEIRNAMDGKG